LDKLDVEFASALRALAMSKVNIVDLETSKDEIFGLSTYLSNYSAYLQAQIQESERQKSLDSVDASHLRQVAQTAQNDYDQLVMKSAVISNEIGQLRKEST
jgi:radical SAM superfamily enzyme with C-terminal helix-hairpin-helix motif